MARLIYSAIASLDGYIEDRSGAFDWSAPDEEVHAFINTLERPIGTYLYGRRMYETMTYWETAHTLPDQPAVARNFTAMWQAARKIVYSASLDRVSTARTQIERSFDPKTVRRLKAAADRDITVGGADLAAQAWRAGLVDELQLFVVPVMVGGGKRSLPDRIGIDLELVDFQRFRSGVVFVRYRLKPERRDPGAPNDPSQGRR